MSAIIPVERVERCILLLRGHRVMLSPHLAELYEVEPKALMQAVRRNLERFPHDFMFRLTWDEIELLRSQSAILDEGAAPPSRSQIVILNTRGRRSRSQSVTLKRGSNVKYLPYAFTEQGVAMLSSVLRSKRAVQVNIGIMRAFVKFRELLASHAELARKLEELERRYDAQFRVVFDAIDQLMQGPTEATPQIGFLTGEPGVPYRRRRAAAKA